MGFFSKIFGNKPETFDNVKVDREVIDSMIYYSKEAYPREFLSLLEGKIVDNTLYVLGLIFLPGETCDTGAVLHDYMIPPTLKYWGTAHCHPGPSARPSDADLATFSKHGVFHLILCLPYSLETFIGYNKHGEQMDFEEVSYWDEIMEIFDWARTHVTSTLYICWAAQAGLYHHYGVPKYALDKKMFGIFEHRTLDPLQAIFRGFDDTFYVPHSRHTEVRKEDIVKVPELTLLSESDESGVYMVMARGGREFFVTGHSEYSPLTLDTEYRRDLAKGLPIDVPRNYYIDDDPEKGPVVRWRAHANLLFSNWLNYFVYQETPYDINDIK